MPVTICIVWANVQHAILGLQMSKIFIFYKLFLITECSLIRTDDKVCRMGGRQCGGAVFFGSSKLCGWDGASDGWWWHVTDYSGTLTSAGSSVTGYCFAPTWSPATTSRRRVLIPAVVAAQISSTLTRGKMTASVNMLCGRPPSYTPRDLDPCDLYYHNVWPFQLKTGTPVTPAWGMFTPILILYAFSFSI